MQGAKFYAILVASVMLVSLSPAFSTLLPHVVIRSTGTIGEYGVTAKSGSAEDIQVAVDQVAGMGGGKVYIPEGTFNFTDGAPWQKVNVNLANFPNGLSILGAPTERTSGLPYDGTGMNPNDQVIEWKTVLVMPWEAPNGIEWFNIDGADIGVEPSIRISDIKLVGHKTFDPSNTNHEYWSFDMNNVFGFRIDHCMLEHITGGIPIDTNVNGECYGVIDHCKLVNPLCTNPDYGVEVTYGVDLSHHPDTTRWEPIDQVLGKATEYTTFIEDCYFSRWRHCAASGYGAHYTIRHCTIEDDIGYGSIDAHGVYRIVGTRALEVYNNAVIDPFLAGGEVFDAIRVRGGTACIFNNISNDYQFFIYLQQEGSPPYAPPTVYEWNNTVTVTRAFTNWDELIHHRPPNLAQDGFAYTPYTYPHPLTLG